MSTASKENSSTTASNYRLFQVKCRLRLPLAATQVYRWSGQPSHSQRKGARKRNQRPPSSCRCLRDVVEMGDVPRCNICGAICSRSSSCFKCGPRPNDWMRMT
jgi:hypothetical protein